MGFMKEHASSKYLSSHNTALSNLITVLFRHTKFFLYIISFSKTIPQHIKPIHDSNVIHTTNASESLIQTRAPFHHPAKHSTHATNPRPKTHSSPLHHRKTALGAAPRRSGEIPRAPTISRQGRASERYFSRRIKAAASSGGAITSLPPPSHPYLALRPRAIKIEPADKDELVR